LKANLPALLVAALIAAPHMACAAQGTNHATPAVRWSRAPDATIARQEIYPAVLGERIIVAGGVLSQPPGFTDHVEAFDVKTGRWTTLAPLPEWRHHIALAEAGGELLARVLAAVPLSRVGVAGGDTSSLAVGALDAWGLSYLAQLAPGTALQNAGEMASPRGPRGGVGPGEVGNFIVTGHRLTGTAPLRYSPSLRRGDRISVRSGDTVFVYEVRRTRWTSFREPASLRAQRAEVPGRPGETATRAMITLSTCATPEDHAVGNYWSDEFDNPEHRIDKIGVLVATRPA